MPVTRLTYIYCIMIIITYSLFKIISKVSKKVFPTSGGIVRQVITAVGL